MNAKDTDTLAKLATVAVLIPAALGINALSHQADEQGRTVTAAAKACTLATGQPAACQRAALKRYAP